MNRSDNKIKCLKDRQLKTCVPVAQKVYSNSWECVGLCRSTKYKCDKVRNCVQLLEEDGGEIMMMDMTADEACIKAGLLCIGAESALWETSGYTSWRTKNLQPRKTKKKVQ